MHRMKYFYFMSTVGQAICNGNYVVIIRTSGLQTQHQPNLSSARILFVKNKHTTRIIHNNGRIITGNSFPVQNKMNLKGAASQMRKTYRTPDFITGRFDDLASCFLANLYNILDFDKTRTAKIGLISPAYWRSWLFSSGGCHSVSRKGLPRYLWLLQKRFYHGQDRIQ